MESEYYFSGIIGKILGPLCGSSSHLAIFNMTVSGGRKKKGDICEPKIFQGFRGGDKS